MTTYNFDGRVALVTGGGSGIGEYTSKELAADGAKVVVVDLNLENAERVVSEIKEAGGEAVAFKADTSSPEDNKAAVDFAVETYGKLNYAVNNAGIGGKNAATGELDIEDWNKVIDINLNGVAYGMRYQIPAMLEAGGSECAIVNMASVHGMVSAIGNAAYTASKHGVVGLTRNAASEHGPDCLRINAVGPGYIETPLIKSSLDTDILEGLKGKHMLGRLGQPEEIAHLVTFLLSDRASFISGGYYLADGGYTVV